MSCGRSEEEELLLICVVLVLLESRDDLRDVSSSLSSRTSVADGTGHGDL